jgi:hypothetical protein
MSWKLSRRLYRSAGGSTPKRVPARPLPDWARVREELVRNSRDVGPRFHGMSVQLVMYDSQGVTLAGLHSDSPLRVKRCAWAHWAQRCDVFRREA